MYITLCMPFGLVSKSPSSASNCGADIKEKTCLQDIPPTASCAILTCSGFASSAPLLFSYIKDVLACWQRCVGTGCLSSFYTDLLKRKERSQKRCFISHSYKWKCLTALGNGPLCSPRDYESYNTG